LPEPVYCIFNIISPFFFMGILPSYVEYLLFFRTYEIRCLNPSCPDRSCLQMIVHLPPLPPPWLAISVRLIFFELDPFQDVSGGVPPLSQWVILWCTLQQIFLPLRFLSVLVLLAGLFCRVSMNPLQGSVFSFIRS